MLILGATVLSCREVRVVSLAPATPNTSIDSVQIDYTFWMDKGKVSFVIINNRSQPIYIDLKKCILFINQGARNYWENKTMLAGVGATYTDRLGIRHGASVVESYTPERINFIAPHSSLSFSFPFLPNFVNKLNNEQTIDTLLKRGVRKVLFETTNTPLSIRNYLTFSNTESFEQEVSVENVWYCHKILTMKPIDFWEEESSESTPFKDAYSYYYLFIPETQ